ncbi:nucleoside-diphosphate-sugar epimerase [Winogradskyella epiphytica]|uniref:Nucleoside-diphosphate-sugar epimerase n=1 Tax=Winogradskyella epiphytica TaxID=262005 RepID=A0A2V4XWJ6_9FLAO|nr:NAD(P)H-binding protein [Winogradskyella epiphytica]PYE83177.1 nucleoside-diphosphate-sugar epimerase [Winogradskyella epiphytica]GGW56390.1 epimerase [Winogradskyella epiphytica]
MKTQISIIGCGWLGLPLAKNLINEEYIVKGSTTSSNKLEVLISHNIQPFLVSLEESGISGNYSEFLKGSSILIINIPPGLRKNPNKNHVKEIKHLIKAAEQQSIEKVLYISSTSVFEDEAHFPIITAETPPNATSNSSKQLIDIEALLQTTPNFKTTILRFGGLIGDDRHPAKYLAGRTGVSNPKAPINLIHQSDCISIITSIVKKNHWGTVFNAAFPFHPNKSDYYISYCNQKNLAAPKFNTSEESKGKLVDSSKLVQLLNYSFKVRP